MATAALLLHRSSRSTRLNAQLFRYTATMVPPPPPARAPVGQATGAGPPASGRRASFRPPGRPVRWLDDDEQAAWRAFLAASQLLMDQLDRELQAAAGIPHAYYE